MWSFRFSRESLEPEAAHHYPAVSYIPRSAKNRTGVDRSDCFVFVARMLYGNDRTGAYHQVKNWGGFFRKDGDPTLYPFVKKETQTSSAPPTSAAVLVNGE